MPRLSNQSRPHNGFFPDYKREENAKPPEGSPEGCCGALVVVALLSSLVMILTGLGYMFGGIGAAFVGAGLAISIVSIILMAAVSSASDQRKVTPPKRRR